MFKNVKTIDVDDWDVLVSRTYARTYNFQQQDGCKERGIAQFTVPMDYAWNYKNDTVPEVVNGDEMGVSLNGWLARDPDKMLESGDEYDKDIQGLCLFYERNFYPSLESIADDLYNRGILEAGDYVINIDW